ncbi:MAG TPA: cytochrome P460 family protein [Blastocatellia bacterium]|nr:cytochrome P460 family protein [Blastocatellia bacterium]
MSKENNSDSSRMGLIPHLGKNMKQITLVLVAFAASGVVAFTARASRNGMPRRIGSPSAPVFVTSVPEGYRDWAVISVAHEAGSLNSLGAVLGNDIAIKALREGKLPYPDGSIIAALHWQNTPSAENDKIFGKPQSFVPGAPTNIQFMVKDSSKYAATGGWGFGHFAPDGKPAAEAFMQSCYPCHAKIPSTDLVFTHYAP